MEDVGENDDDGDSQCSAVDVSGPAVHANGRPVSAGSTSRHRQKSSSTSTPTHTHTHTHTCVQKKSQTCKVCGKEEEEDDGGWVIRNGLTTFRNGSVRPVDVPVWQVRQGVQDGGRAGPAHDRLRERAHHQEEGRGGGGEGSRGEGGDEEGQDGRGEDGVNGVCVGGEYWLWCCWQIQ